MLVLSRRVREQILLPGLDVVLTVLEVRGGKVRLGITAPDEIAVFREELWRRLQQDSANAEVGPIHPSCHNLPVTQIE